MAPIPSYSNRQVYLIVAALGMLLLGHHLWGYVGHFGFDDIHYARLSRQFAEGVFQTSLGDHYTFRWGLIWLNGLMYKVFGMGDHSSTIVPLTATLLTLWLVGQMSVRLSLPARAFAMTFTALSEWVFFYSDKIMPDILVMLCSTAAIASIWQHRWGTWQGRPVRSALGLAISLLAGFLCKETILLILPLFGWLCVSDLWQRERRRFWGSATLFGAVGMLLYFTAIYALTGDALGRFHAIAANSYFSACSYDQLPVEHLLRRIGRDLWRVFFESGVAVGFVFLLPALFLRRDGRSLLQARSEADFFLFCAAGLILLSNFMTISPTAYLPLCPDIRHYLFAVPLLGIAAASSAADFIEKPVSVKHYVIVGLAVLAAVVAWMLFPDQFKLYGSLALVSTLVLLLKLLKTKYLPNVAWLLLGTVLLWKPVRVMREAQTSNYPEQKAFVQQQFNREVAPRNLVVISNIVEKNIDEYLLNFDTTGVRFLSFKQVTPASIASADSIALIINGTTAYLSGMDWEAMPFWVKQPDASRRLIATAKHIELFGLDKGDLLRRLEIGR